MRFSVSSLLIFSLLSLFCQNPTSAQCPQEQKSSLLSLFSSLNNLSWNPNTDCCSWDGVMCDGSTGHVISLVLANRLISASINSTTLISLSSLQTLNLSFNLFNSPFPTGLGGLSNLTHLNLSNSGFAGRVPVEISGLKSLESLDLSSSFLNSLSPVLLPNPDFGYVVGNLSGLRELYLDDVVISSSVPESLAGLANLSSLHLNSCNLTGEFPRKILQMWNLESLDVSNNPRLTGTLPEFQLNNSLQMLMLSGTNFFGQLPSSFGNLRFLKRLRIGSCNFSGWIPLSVFGITELIDLDISSNSFSGLVPSSLENLTQLIHLDLSSNKLSGRIPSLDNLTQLVELDFSSNNFSGEISSLGSRLPNLTKLDLHNNSLSGKIPSSLFMFLSLKLLDLSHNQFNEQLDEFQNASASLNTVDLSNNNLQGNIPGSVIKFEGLKVLLLSSNNFSGIIQLTMLENLKNLSNLDLSDNLLSINMSGMDISSFPQVGTLKLRSCNLTEFPNFLTNQSRLVTLDISNNKIDGEIPNWIWKIGNWSLTYLNLSHNLVTSLEQPPIDLSSSQLKVLDLHSNKLQGSFPFPPPSVLILDYSHNNFTFVIPANITSYLDFTIFFSLSSNKISGEIPTSICTASYLQILDMSNNSLSGLIPECLGQMGYNLLVLNLGRNKFTGTLPQSFVDGCSLRTLNLNGNQLEGSLPRSLANCSHLEVLNLGNNRIEDSFPSWLGYLQQLQVLILRSNKLYGPIGPPKDGYTFPRLQIIDLSSNGFTGNLSSECFENLKAMMDDEDERQSKLRHQSLRFGFLKLNPLYYQETLTVTIKGLEMEFLKILTIFTSVDLSCNKFQGKIPAEVGNLKSLYGLNMSHNELTGPMPSSFGNLRQLESLDLSMNQLSGEIPWVLTSLTFLSVLNLSYNFFIGEIPQVNQFATFQSNSFQGNPELCGLPLSRICVTPSVSKTDGLHSRNEFNWQFIWIGLGFGGGIGMIFGPLVFWKKGRRWYYKYVDKMLFMVMPEGTWSLINCDSGKIEAEERMEQELMEIESDMEREEEQSERRFCVFCTKIDVSWERVIHRECSCPDASPQSSSQGSQITEETDDREKDGTL